MSIRSAKGLRKKLDGLPPMDRDQLIRNFVEETAQEFFVLLLVEKGVPRKVALDVAISAWAKHGPGVIA